MRLDVHVGARNEEVCVKRSGRRWACVRATEREGRGRSGRRTAASCNDCCRRCRAKARPGRVTFSFDDDITNGSAMQ